MGILGRPDPEMSSLVLPSASDSPFPPGRGPGLAPVCRLPVLPAWKLRGLERLRSPPGRYLEITVLHTTFRHASHAL